MVRRRMGATMAVLRAAPTDTTTTIPILALRTDITAQIGSITASSWASVPGTVGAGDAAADTGATIGAIAAVMAIAADTGIAEDTDAAVTDIGVVAAIMAAAGLIPVAVDSTAVEAATMVAVAEAASTVVGAAADSTAVVVGSAAATVVAVADTGKHQSVNDRRKRLASASRFLLYASSLTGLPSDKCLC
jgi:hypothetical protein